MRRRSRSRRRGSRRRWFGSVSVVLVLAALVFGIGLPGAAFDTASVNRPVSSNVVGDPSGAAELNVTSELQEGTSGQCLVTITNNLGRDVTVETSLRSDSTHLGELQREDDVLGLQKGDTIEFSLASGEKKTVNMNVDSGTAGSTTYFHVNATASGLTVSVTDRSTPIVSSAGTTCA